MRRMFKVLVSVLAVVLVVGSLASVALAEGPRSGQSRGRDGQRTVQSEGQGMHAWDTEGATRGEGTFVDKDGDGLCDECGEACGEEEGDGQRYGDQGLCNGERPVDGEGNAYGQRFGDQGLGDGERPLDGEGKAYGQRGSGQRGSGVCDGECEG